jgi:predicted secreted protein
LSSVIASPMDVGSATIWEQRCLLSILTGMGHSPVQKFLGIEETARETLAMTQADSVEQEFTNPKKPVEATTGQKFTIILDANHDTGYRWEIASSPDSKAWNWLGRSTRPPMMEGLVQVVGRSGPFRQIAWARPRSASNMLDHGLRMLAQPKQHLLRSLLARWD